MFANKTTLIFGTSSNALLLVIASLCLIHCKGNKQQAAPDAKKGEDSGTAKSDDADTPDKPAPVSGAYLTCFVPPPKSQDQYIVSGCQMRDKNNKRVNLRSASRRNWTFVPPQGSKTKFKIAVFDLTHTSKQMYFDAVYRLTLPKAGAVTATTSVGSSRAALTNYFLHAAPLALPQSAPQNSIKGATPISSRTPLALTGSPCNYATFACLGVSAKSRYPDIERSLETTPASGFAAFDPAAAGSFVPNRESESWIYDQAPEDRDGVGFVYENELDPIDYDVAYGNAERQPSSGAWPEDMVFGRSPEEELNSGRDTERDITSEYDPSVYDENYFGGDPVQPLE